MRSIPVLILTLALASTASAQSVISPYDPPPPVPARPPPPPPPQGYYQQPYYYYQSPQPYYYKQPAPRVVCEVERRNYGLLVAGLVIFGASYSINAAVAYGANEWKLAVPLVGPFLETANVDTSNSLSSSERAGNRMLVGMLVFDGLIQATGIAMAIAGAATKHRVRIYERVALVPNAGQKMAGLAAVGRF
jgi:hypothetical protein